MILPACAVLGDGANDVSMIQVADVGVGISGQEGMQVRTGGCPGQQKGSHCEPRWAPLSRPAELKAWILIQLVLTCC